FTATSTSIWAIQRSSRAILRRASCFSRHLGASAPVGEEVPLRRLVHQPLRERRHGEAKAGLIGRSRRIKEIDGRHTAITRRARRQLPLAHHLTRRPVTLRQQRMIVPGVIDEYEN